MTIEDFLTKPIQGTLFKNCRDIIMCIAPFPMEEHVETKEKLSIAKECNHANMHISPTERMKKTDVEELVRNEQSKTSSEEKGIII